MTTAALERPTDEMQALRDAFARYHAAWEAQDPDRIADLHSADSWFWMHDGSARVEGRETLRRHYKALFERYPRIAFVTHRTLFGERRWVYDYTMVLTLQDADGRPFTAELAMVDVVDVNARYEVTRKDVFLDVEAVQAVRAKAGDA